MLHAEPSSHERAPGTVLNVVEVFRKSNSILSSLPSQPPATVLLSMEEWLLVRDIWYTPFFSRRI